MTEDLHYLSAADALRLFRGKELSPVELMQAIIARADAVEGRLGAFTQTYFEEALEQAKQAESKYAKTDALRPLEGLPVAIKEDKGVKGRPTSAGSIVFRDGIAAADALPVERIRDAGAIIHARTNVCEMGAAAITGGRLFPPTRNPWNPDFNSGGSSGGAGAALAAGTTTLANGSDYCGSIRIPASACGVVGYKPPRGRNPVSPFFNIDWYDHDGPMARTVADCALLQNAMTGHHPADPFSLRESVTLPDRFDDISRLRIGLSIDLGYFEVDAEVAANTREVADRLKDLGAIVEEVEVAWTPDTLKAFRNHSAVVFGSWVADYIEANRDVMTDYAIALAEDGLRVTAKDFLDSMDVEARMWGAFGPILEQYDAVICPTLALPSVPLHHSPQESDLAINGKPVEADFGWCMTYPFNMLSPCPVLAVPSGFASTGVPTGIQIIGRSYDDVGVFRVGAAWEKSQNGQGYPSRRPDLHA